MKRLTQADVRRLPDGLHGFGDGLYLMVRGESRSWVLRVQLDGKRTMRGLGSALEITLAQARIEAAKLKLEMLGGDTRTKSQKAREARAEESKSKAFEDVWEEAVEARARVARWKNDRQRHQWEQSIRDHALPVLGKLDVSGITREDVLRALRPIWDSKTETASRVRSRLETIFDWCIRNGLREKENPARWRGALAFDLPSRAKVQAVKHHSAASVLDLQTVAPRLILSTSGCAILFGILTTTRVQEFVRADWGEVNLKKAVWTIPPARRKDGRPEPFRVPMSKQVVALLAAIKPADVEPDDAIFPGLTGKYLSLETPRAVLRKLLQADVTMHGCRSTFRDWAAEKGIDHAVAEKCLMHTVGSKVVQAYQRSDFLQQRKVVMQQWADVICAKLASDP